MNRLDEIKRRRKVIAISWRELARMVAALALWLSLAAAGGRPLPVHIDTGPIVVRAEAGMESHARKIAKHAPEMLREIAEDLPGLDLPPHVEIRLVHKASSLPDVAPPGRGAPHWAAGLAYSDLGIVTIAHASGTELNDIMSVTSHELGHLALGAALKGQAPRWLNEGFAYLHSSDFSVARMQVLTAMAWSGNTIPLQELDRSFPQQELSVHRAYAQSYDFVAFLAKRGRYADKRDDGDPWPFRNFLAAIAEGKNPNQAAIDSFGASIYDLYAEWFQDLRERYMLVPASLFGLFVWSFAALLLVIGYWRKRKRSERILAVWEREEARREVLLAPRPHADTAPQSSLEGSD